MTERKKLIDSAIWAICYAFLNERKFIKWTSVSIIYDHRGQEAPELQMESVEFEANTQKRALFGRAKAQRPRRAVTLWGFGAS
jgi:hypothetical protein